MMPSPQQISAERICFLSYRTNRDEGVWTTGRHRYTQVGFRFTTIINLPNALFRFLRDAFIYEYVGEVVSHPSFAKRMREYAEEGIRHFYFMMLQKDEVRFLRSIRDPLNSRAVYRCYEEGRYWSFR